MSTTIDDTADQTADQSAPTRSRGKARIAVVLAGVLLLAAVGAGLVAWLGADPAQAPYSDPASAGRLALCGADGKPLSEGATTDSPFAATVVGTTPAGPGYDGEGRTASLFAYQPREGVQPTDWSGMQLAAPTRYDDPAQPLAELGSTDVSLAQFLGGYPATYDGWVQLRLYLGAPDQPLQSQAYDTVDLQVDGGSWRVVDASATGCAH